MKMYLRNFNAVDITNCPENRKKISCFRFANLSLKQNLELANFPISFLLVMNSLSFLSALAVFAFMTAVKLRQ
jgi:hypothetical protein